MQLSNFGIVDHSLQSLFVFIPFSYRFWKMTKLMIEIRKGSKE